MRPVLFLALVGSLSFATWAQAGEPQVDHAAHHPAGASAPVSAKSSTPQPDKPVAKKTSAGRDAKSTAAVHSSMNAMHDMHEKMMAAKTPAEREALMGEHMKAMQDGMAMMKQMKKDTHGRPMDCEAMGKRMDMMESMMQMMMDRQAAQPSTK